MARTAASSRPRARPTRSSSLSDSAAACWARVTGIGGILRGNVFRFDSLDALPPKRFPPRPHSEQNPLPVVFFSSFARRPCGRRRRRPIFGVGISFHQFSVVIGGAIDRGRNLIGFEQVFRSRANQRRRSLYINILAIEPQVEGVRRDDDGHPLMNAGKCAIGARRHDGGGFHLLAVGTSPCLPESCKSERLTRLRPHVIWLFAWSHCFPLIKAVGRNKAAPVLHRRTK